MTPAERAAALSARIHREINAGRFVLGLPTDTSGCDTTFLTFRRDGTCTGCALGAAAFALGLRKEGRVRTFVGAEVGPDAAGHIEGGFERYGFRNLDQGDPFYRLGAELRAIALGNREGAK